MGFWKKQRTNVKISIKMFKFLTIFFMAFQAIYSQVVDFADTRCGFHKNGQIILGILAFVVMFGKTISGTHQNETFWGFDKTMSDPCTRFCFPMLNSKYLETTTGQFLTTHFIKFQ